MVTFVSIQNSCLIDHYYDGMDWTINHMDGNWTIVGNATELYSKSNSISNNAETVREVYASCYGLLPNRLCDV